MFSNNAGVHIQYVLYNLSLGSLRHIAQDFLPNSYNKRTLNNTVKNYLVIKWVDLL